MSIMTLTIDDISSLTAAQKQLLAAIAGVAAPAGGATGTGSTGTGSTGSTGSGSSGQTQAPQPILTMPAGIATGAPVDIGTGPDQLAFQVATNPNSPGQTATFDVVIDGIGIAQGLLVTANTGEVGGQRFTLRGTFGPGPHTIQQVYTDPAGGNGTFNNGVQFNLAPCYANGGYDSRGVQSVNATSVFLTKGHIVIWTTQPQNAAAPTGGTTGPVPALSTITASINGTPKTDTLANLIAATPAGGTLTLPAGKFVGTSAIGTPCTIAGAGQGKTIIDCTGLPPTFGKGVFVPTVPGVILEHMTIQGASVSDANGAGIRDNAAGIGFTATDVEFTANQDGILTFASPIDLNGIYAHDNGAGDGFSHELYIGGGPASVATLTNCTVAAGAKACHALKTRAGTTTVTGSLLTGSQDTTGNVGGSVIDIPDGGSFTMTGGLIALAPNAGNRLALGYAMESAGNAAAGKTVTLKNVVFETDCMIQNGKFIPDAILVLEGCTYKSANPPQISGFGTVTGTVAKAA